MESPETEFMISGTSTISSLVRGVRWFTSCVISAATIYSVLALSTVPKFERVFQDMLGPDVSLPPATTWLIRSYPYSLIGVLLLSVITIISVFRFQSPGAVLCAAGAAVVIHVVVGVWTISALLSPISTMLQGMTQ